MIFGRRWYGIRGESIGEGAAAVHVIRIQTNPDGPWQSLNKDEIEFLLAEHNAIIKSREVEFEKAKPKADPVGKVIRDAVRKKPAKKTVKKAKAKK